MSQFTITQYENAGCHLTKDKVGVLPFHLLHQAAGGVLCPGCFHHSEKGGCSAEKKLTTKPVGRTRFNVPVETVREEAARRGISISEVRRQRNGSSQ